MREKKQINIQIGDNVRIARERAGLTQEAFGELVSLGTKNVSMIERGVAGITVSTLKRICEKLSISSDLILFGDTGAGEADYMADRLKRLPREQQKAVLRFLNSAIELFGRLEQSEDDQPCKRED